MCDDDPRPAMQPWLRELVSDQAVAAWRQHRVCLCGCGLPITCRTGHGRSQEGWAHFRRGHARGMAPEGFFRGRTRQSPASREKIRRAKRNQAIDSAGIGLLVAEYLAEHDILNKDFAAKAGVSRNWLSLVKSGSQKRIRRTHARKLLIAMGEDVPSYLLLPQQHRRLISEAKRCS